MNIVIPSYKRWDNLVGKDYFYMAKYVVPESQSKEYIEVLGVDRVIICPDNEDGSIGKKRNWILKNIQRPFIMIDDDVSSLRLYENKKEFTSGRRIDESELDDIFYMLFNLAEEFDSKMFGLLPLSDPGAYLEYKPFSLTSMVLGPFTGHREHDLLYDEEMGSKDDYDMCIQQMNKYKKVLRYNKICYMDAGTEKSSGGIVSYRTMEKEVDWCRKIMKKWGTKIIEYKIPPKKLTDVLNAQKFRIPIKGV